jgi:hypothetical protein
LSAANGSIDRPHLVANRARNRMVGTDELETCFELVGLEATAFPSRLEQDLHRPSPLLGFGHGAWWYALCSAHGRTLGLVGTTFFRHL